MFITHLWNPVHGMVHLCKKLKLLNCFVSYLYLLVEWGFGSQVYLTLVHFSWSYPHGEANRNVDVRSLALCTNMNYYIRDSGISCLDNESKYYYHLQI